MASLLLAVIYLAFIGLGLPDSLLGSGWPVMHEELGAPLSAMGLISMIIAAGTVVSSLASDLLTRKLGTGLVTFISVLMTAGAMLAFSFARTYWLLCVLAVPYGLGAGGVDAALNNYVALYYKSRHMSWLHCFWGVGALISPFIMSYALAGGGGWGAGYSLVSYIQFGLCSRGDGNAVGKQLFHRSQGTGCRNCGDARLAVLHRNYRRTVCLRIHLRKTRR